LSTLPPTAKVPQESWCERMASREPEAIAGGPQGLAAAPGRRFRIANTHREVPVTEARLWYR